MTTFKVGDRVSAFYNERHGVVTSLYGKSVGVTWDDTGKELKESPLFLKDINPVFKVGDRVCTKDASSDAKDIYGTVVSSVERFVNVVWDFDSRTYTEIKDNLVLKPRFNIAKGDKVEHRQTNWVGVALNDPYYPIGGHVARIDVEWDDDGVEWSRGWVNLGYIKKIG